MDPSLRRWVIGLAVSVGVGLVALTVEVVALVGDHDQLAHVAAIVFPATWVAGLVCSIALARRGFTLWRKQ